MLRCCRSTFASARTSRSSCARCRAGSKWWCSLRRNAFTPRNCSTLLTRKPTTSGMEFLWILNLVGCVAFNRNPRCSIEALYHVLCCTERIDACILMNVKLNSHFRRPKVKFCPWYERCFSRIIDQHELRGRVNMPFAHIIRVKFYGFLRALACFGRMNIILSCDVLLPPERQRRSAVILL